MSRRSGTGGGRAPGGAEVDAARRAAFEVLHAVRRHASWDAAWEEQAGDLGCGSLDRRFAQELVSGTLRLRGRLDFVLASHVDRPLDELDADVLDVLRLGAYQLLEVDRVADWSGVHATVELAKQVSPRAVGLVNAVLRALLRAGKRVAFPEPAREPLRHLVTAGSHPEWIVKRWLERFGFEECERLCDYDNRRPQLCLRVNLRRTTRDAVLSRLDGARPGRWSPVAVRCPGLRFAAVRGLVEQGLVSVQDESGILVGEMLAPLPGERWLDLAAAPGGKACHLAELLGGTGSVLALDVSPEKVGRIRDNVQRLGLDNVVVARGDARQLQPTPCDGVLVDAPCSGLGVLGRRPDARWRKRPADLQRLPELQLELLEAALRHLRPHGVLVYSVCSFEPEETTQVVERFGLAHPELALEPGAAPETLRTVPGILYSFPQRHGIDGGFVARWRRTS